MVDVPTDNNTSDQDSPSITQASPQTPMMVQYWDIKNKHKECLLFFRMGDFYELFFEDAIVASKELDITLTQRGKAEGQDIPMCGVPFHAYEGYMAKLIQKGYKVAICEQLESPEEAKKRGYKSIVKRDVIRIVTAGTLTDESLLSASSHNFLTALYKSKNSDHYALASADLSTGDFFIETVEAANLTAMLGWIQPAEIIIQDSLYEARNTQSELQPLHEKEWRNKLTFLPDSRFDYENAHKRLLNLYNVKTLDGFGTMDKDQIRIAGTLVDYIYLTQKKSLSFLKRPTIIKSGDYLIIDPVTRRSLELDITLSGAKQGSLLNAIDETLTAGGARLLRFRFLGPLTKVEDINNRLDDVSNFINSPDSLNECRTTLKLCPDIERALSRLCIGRGTPRDLAALRDGLKVAADLQDFFKNTNNENISKNVKHALEDLGEFGPLKHNLIKALSDTLPSLLRDGGFIEDGYNQELDDLRYTRDHSKDIIRDFQNKYIQKTGINTLKIKHNNVLGYHIDVTPQHGPKMTTDFIHRQTLASSMRYTTPELSEVEQRINQAMDKALAIEIEIFENFVKQVQQQSEQLLALCHALSVIDVSTALAHLAIKNNFIRPVVDQSRMFFVEKGRHSVVEKALKSKNEPFIPNNCSLDENQTLILLTGPNMAGKSTYLRQNALLVILAQMGSFVPADKFHLGVVDRLFSRVGASDDLAAGRSTFMVEMVETAAILNQATNRSLVILDEIGRGTATYDGMAIAWAVVEALCDVNKCRSFFATHYHELTQLQKDKPMIKCMTIKIQEWDDKIIFMHEVIDGTADKSYGIHVAALAGLPVAVLLRAEDILNQLVEGASNKKSVPINKNFSKQSIAPQLSFGFEQEKAPSPAPIASAVESELKLLNIDELSPKQALEKLYQLKGYLN